MAQKSPTTTSDSLADASTSTVDPVTIDPSDTSQINLSVASADASGYLNYQDEEKDSITTPQRLTKRTLEWSTPRFTSTPRVPDIVSENRRSSVIQMDKGSIPEIEAPKRFSGESTYRQTVIFLLALACSKVFPDRQLVIQSTYAITLKLRSYYCRFVNSECNPNDIKLLKNEMETLKKLEIPIHSIYMEYSECLEHLKETKQLYSYKLALTLNESRYKMVGCKLPNNKKFYVLQYRHLLANTKYVHSYNIFHEPHNDDKNDFIIAFPDKTILNKNQIIKLPNAALSLRKLYYQGVKLGKILGLECVGDLNELIQKGRTKELILLSEAYHDMQIVHIASKIHKQKEESNNKLKVILISGPSSSGKTTFASKLCIQLKLLGLNPISLEVDMYYKDRGDETHPIDKKTGELNFEIIDAIRINYLQEQINFLLNGKEIIIPNFSFKDGKIHENKINPPKLKLPKNGILVMEGIFCLNPKLTTNLNKNEKFKIFMCPISFFNLDNLHFLSEQIIRLVRRVSRDHRHRNKKAHTVLFKWGQLQGGEDTNIFPFIEEADHVFNSTLPYEVPVLKVFTQPLLQTVSPKEPQFKDAKNVLEFLNSFLSMPDSGIPSTSLIMEFIGNSVYDEINEN